MGLENKGGMDEVLPVLFERVEIWEYILELATTL